MNLVENVDQTVADNESIPKDRKVIPDKHGIQEPLKDTGKMGDDDMEDQTSLPAPGNMDIAEIIDLLITKILVIRI